MMRPAEMHQMEIVSELMERFPSLKRDRIVAPHSGYNMVTERAVSAFKKELGRKFFDTNIKYEHAFACYAFSLAAVNKANLKHLAAARRGTRVAQGVAFGMIFYFQETGALGSGHVANIYRTLAGWKTLEPQTQKTFQMTQREIEDTTFILI